MRWGAGLFSLLSLLSLLISLLIVIRVYPALQSLGVASDTRAINADRHVVLVALKAGQRALHLRITSWPIQADFKVVGQLRCVNRVESACVGPVGFIGFNRPVT